MAINHYRTWGYSGVVGSWDFNIPLPTPKTPYDYYQSQKLFLSSMFEILSSLHVVKSGSIDIIYLDKIGSTYKDIHYVEGEEIVFSSFSSVIEFMDNEILQHKDTYFSCGDFTLDTTILHNEKDFLIPSSAYILFSSVDSWGYLVNDPQIIFSYETFIDVWLEKTLNSNHEWRANKKYAKANKPRINKIISTIEQSFEVKSSSNSSRYYSNFINESGFK